MNLWNLYVSLSINQPKFKNKIINKQLKHFKYTCILLYNKIEANLHTIYIHIYLGFFKKYFTCYVLLSGEFGQSKIILLFSPET